MKINFRDTEFNFADEITQIYYLSIDEENNSIGSKMESRKFLDGPMIAQGSYLCEIDVEDYLDTGEFYLTQLKFPGLEFSDDNSKYRSYIFLTEKEYYDFIDNMHKINPNIFVLNLLRKEN